VHCMRLGSYVSEPDVLCIHLLQLL